MSNDIWLSFYPINKNLNFCRFFSNSVNVTIIYQQFTHTKILSTAFLCIIWLQLLSGSQLLHKIPYPVSSARSCDRTQDHSPSKLHPSPKPSDVLLYTEFWKEKYFAFDWIHYPKKIAIHLRIAVLLLPLFCVYFNSWYSRTAANMMHVIAARSVTPTYRAHC